MILELYSIYDRVSGVYAAPFLSHNGNTALRQFQYQMSQATMIAMDCDLYFMGYFNSETGVITLPEGDKPVYIGRVKQEVKKDESI